MKSGSLNLLESSGPVQACNGIPLPLPLPFTHLLSRPQGHSAAGSIMSMKNSNDTIWNRTRDFPTCEKFVVIYKIEMSSVKKQQQFAGSWLT